MKVVILAGGRGSRLGEVTEVIPKPMVRIGDKPMLHHIMNIYARQMECEFLIAGGYLHHIIGKWLKETALPYPVELVYTGRHTGTGGRLYHLRDKLRSRFCLTYGDGLANIDFQAEENHHNKMDALCTMTVVHPPPRWGEVVLDNGLVKEFSEKPLERAWINGGFFMCDPRVLDYLDGNASWEIDGLMQLAKHGRLAGYQHNGFWQCVDTPADLERVNRLEKEGAPWA